MEPWWQTRPYRDMAMRRRDYLDCTRQQFLDRRRIWIRDPYACLGASFAIAGAAAVSRMKLLSIDDVFRLMVEMRQAGF